MDPLHRYPERDIITTIKPVIWKTGIRTYPDPEIPKGNLLGLNNRILDNSRTAFFSIYDEKFASTQYHSMYLR